MSAPKVGDFVRDANGAVYRVAGVGPSWFTGERVFFNGNEGNTWWRLEEQPPGLTWNGIPRAVPGFAPEEPTIAGKLAKGGAR